MTSAGVAHPRVPGRYRALVGLAAGTGLRWGGCVGLRWDAVDLDAEPYGWSGWPSRCRAR
ncbi:hypothetical protein [Microbispora sp. NBRC 16548]|uniref:hypothetical protein n=1 Tax=Microbispora sp. NBRC 16548 TaxID=3030994 RepID=UPI002554DF4A|nr:hypothetical protein [Microbispora sp. NBRC 16548]